MNLFALIFIALVYTIYCEILPKIKYEPWMLEDMPERTRFTNVPECKLLPDTGEYCNGTNTNATSRIVYYFDPEMLECFPMRYKGCMGNENMFDDKEDCKSYCLKSDYDGCRGGIKPSERMCGWNSICEQENLNSTEHYMCSNDYMLVIGKKYDHCCYKASQLFLKSKEDLVRCMGGNFSKGTPVRLDTIEYHPVWLLGRSCSHDFCPENTVCQQGDLFAYCCYPK
uniref:BPTI/Kunitz inhibitor domain-containing protein n=1 Tax=Strongyloides venezuelensis TaxID=75913 RepID=A0A0K0EUE1_STRVS